jgi:hypothetical protein
MSTNMVTNPPASSFAASKSIPIEPTAVPLAGQVFQERFDLAGFNTVAYQHGYFAAFNGRWRLVHAQRRRFQVARIF